MHLLNLGAGSNRPQDEHWTNLDNLYEQFPEGTPERTQLDSEPRYVDHKLPQTLPFVENTFDGLLVSHVLEHFDCHDAVRILYDCHRVLKPCGIAVVSVPDAEYFLRVYDDDKVENAMQLFGEPIHDKWQPKFFDYALFHASHKQVLTNVALTCLFLKAGFKHGAAAWKNCGIHHIHGEIDKIMNRRKFSLEMAGIK